MLSFILRFAVYICHCEAPQEAVAISDRKLNFSIEIMRKTKH